MKNCAGAVILGPTSGGKTALALGLAETLNGEIISCDSMQIYRGMPIGTAQPTADELARAPHHLIAEKAIDELYTAGMFYDLAVERIAEIRSRGKFPIIVGGTGLYAKTLIYGQSLWPTDRQLAADLKARVDRGELVQISDELEAMDPQTFQTVADNWRRILRAREAVELNGGPLTTPENCPPFNLAQFVLHYEPETIRERIARRAYLMLDEGWIEEAETLFEQGLMETPTARQALGYSIIYDYLYPPKNVPNNQKHLLMPTFDDLAERLIVKTCQYAKRQRTWFRHQHPDATFIDMEKHNSDSALKEILAHLEI